MKLYFHRPSAPLDHFVDQFTYYEDHCPDHHIERLFPDGGVYLIIDMTPVPKYIFDNEKLVAQQKCQRYWISGMHKGFISISAGYHSSMFVIRFKPGGSYPFLQLPIAELADQVVDADILLQRDIDFLREALHETPGAPEKFKLVERWLLQRAAGQMEPNPVIEFAVNRLMADPTQANLCQIAEKSGYSQKHFIHLFQKYVGLTPKYFQRIQKFQRVMESLQQQRAVNWTRLAHECGYYDQAHFINEFKHFSGFNPSAYLDQEFEHLNFVPVA